MFTELLREARERFDRIERKLDRILALLESDADD